MMLGPGGVLVAITSGVLAAIAWMHHERSLLLLAPTLIGLFGFLAVIFNAASLISGGE
jgi:hypothetical protein